MRHVIWVFPKERCTAKSNNTNLKNSLKKVANCKPRAASCTLRSNGLKLLTLFLFICLISFSGCGIYSFSGASTAAKNISIEQFFNNTDLAPANLSQTFTNKLKDYYQRNSSLKVVPENGELQVDGVVPSIALIRSHLSHQELKLLMPQHKLVSLFLSNSTT